VVLETHIARIASEVGRKVLKVKLLLLTVTAVLASGIIPPSMMAQENRSGELKHITAAPQNGSRPVSLTALSIVRGAQYPTVISLKGSVEIKTPVCLPSGKNNALVCDGEMIVHADEAEFHEDSGEIQAHGNVQITPLRHRKE
jgi:hypothetical protein